MMLNNSSCKGVARTATLFGGAIGEPSRQKSGIGKLQIAGRCTVEFNETLANQGDAFSRNGSSNIRRRSLPR